MTWLTGPVCGALLLDRGWPEALEEERVKNEKITALRKHNKPTGEYEAGYLPDIHSTSAAVAAAVQQQAQLEVSYERRVRGVPHVASQWLCPAVVSHCQCLQWERPIDQCGNRLPG